MGNRFGGDLYMSNGGTEVFVEVLMLAVSALASREWELRFAALVAAQDQAISGRGTVGFNLEDLDWGDVPTEHAMNKNFVLDTVDLALSHHRWDELGYDPPFAQNFLRRFRQMVEAFDPSTAVLDSRRFPPLEDVVAVSCVRHRVLSPLSYYPECVFCGRDDLT